MTNCLFCKIAKGAIPAVKVAETETLLAFLDIIPQAPTHILIIPKKHIPNNLALDPVDKEMVGEVYLLANKIAKEKGIDATGFRLVTNNGPDAGQAVFHLHFHLLGGRPMGWPPG
jgi:histidine triad (HIT) family protein